MAMLFCATMFAGILLVPAAQAQTFSVLHTFTGAADGAVPGGAGLTIDRGGNLYGGTDFGGRGGQGCDGGSCGVLYKLTRKGAYWVFNTLYEFTGPDGGSPDAPLAFGPDGVLYGTTFYGGIGAGVVYSLQPPLTACKTALCPWTETVLYKFTGADDGAEPAFGALAFDKAGNIYGTTTWGGQYPEYGNVYELTRNNGQWAFNILYSFTGHLDGGSSWTGVTFDASGNLYGITTDGGEYGGGTAFELTPSGQSWTLTPLHQFVPSTDGYESFGNLIFDSSGDLLGTNRYGGPGNAGGVFELTPYNDSWEFGVLYSFTGQNGPQASLAMDPAGNLYGTSVEGGQYDVGFVFKMTPSGSGYDYSVLHNFTGGTDGGYPYGQIVLDANGNLYGATEGGGMKSDYCGNGCGVVWEITP